MFGSLGATAVEIRNFDLELLETYDQLAKGTFLRSRALYVFVPKHHLFQHVFFVGRATPTGMQTPFLKGIALFGKGLQEWKAAKYISSADKHVSAGKRAGAF